MANALQIKMDGMTRRQKMELILILFGHESKRNSPDSFLAFVVGTLANLTTDMSPADFEKFCSPHQCNEPGCNCHVIAAEAVKFFRLLRADVEKEFSQRLKRN